MSGVSSTDSFFFQLAPSYFKVEHGFAKNMKSSSTYRLVIYKGIQKIDQMSEGVKGKLIGGKIIFDPTFLNFYLPIYTPTRNIEFTVKVFEAKPNEAEVQIAQLKLKSGDFVKAFRNESNSIYKQQAQLLENFILVFELFVHNSKLQLDKIVKEHLSKSKQEGRSRILNNRTTTPRKNGYGSQVLSQSDASDISREGAFNSKKKLTRRRGHDGKMRSKNGSRQNSEVGSSREGSVRSSKRGRPFPHNEQNEHFIHSPKKASPPKVEESPTKSQPGKSQNLVSVARKDSNSSEIYNYKNIDSPTKVNKIESNIERSQSTRKHAYSQKSNILPTQTPVVSRRQPLTKREDPKSSYSPKTSDIHNLEFKGTDKVFEITNKKTEAASNSKNYQSQPPKNTYSNTRSAVKSPPVKNQVPKTQPVIEKSSSIRPEVSEIPSQKESIPTAEVIPNPKDGTVVQEQTNEAEAIPISPDSKLVQAKDFKDGKEVREGSVTSKVTGKMVPLIAVKDKQVSYGSEKGYPELKIQQSMIMRRSNTDVQENSPEQQVRKQFQTTRDKLFYVLFFIISSVLFYNAVTPSSKV